MRVLQVDCISVTHLKESPPQSVPMIKKEVNMSSYSRLGISQQLLMVGRVWRIFKWRFCCRL